MDNNFTLPSEEEMEKELKSDGIDVTELEKEVDGETPVMTGYKWYTQNVLHNKEMMSKEEQMDALREYKKTQSPELMEKLILCNQRLVNSIAARFDCYCPIEDLCQEGTIGLMRAIEYFDPDKGYQLSTYATWWIRQAIQRYVCNQSTNIRIPVHMQEEIQSYQKTIKEFASKGIYEPTDQQIMKRAGINEDKLKQVRCSMRLSKTASLSAPIGEDDSETELSDMIEDPTKGVEDTAISNHVSDKLFDDMKAILNEKEFDIVCRRAGCGKYDYIQTLEEVGEVYHVTRERIRQIEERAKRKLTHSWRFRKAWA